MICTFLDSLVFPGRSDRSAVHIASFAMRNNGPKVSLWQGDILQVSSDALIVSAKKDLSKHGYCAYVYNNGKIVCFQMITILKFKGSVVCK